MLLLCTLPSHLQTVGLVGRGVEGSTREVPCYAPLGAADLKMWMISFQQRAPQIAPDAGIIEPSGVAKPPV